MKAKLEKNGVELKVKKHFFSEKEKHILKALTRIAVHAIHNYDWEVIKYMNDPERFPHYDLWQKANEHEHDIYIF